MKPNMTLQSIDKGITVDPSSRDQAISSRVMRGIPSPEDTTDRLLVQGDEEDSPMSFGRSLKAKRVLAALSTANQI